MRKYWRTVNGISRVRLAISLLIRYTLEDLHIGFINFISNFLRSTDIHKSIKTLAIKLGIVKVYESTIPLSISTSSIQQFATPLSKPLIFASYCADVNFQGNLKFCGGTKELNYLVKLLINHGYDAYMVTYDGTYEPWLLDHQPHISLEEFRCIAQSNSDIRCVTSWALATAFIQASPNLYFWDMELDFTEYSHFSALAKLYRSKISNTASISRTIQAWHMAHFQRHCTLLPNLLDESIWFPLPSQRKPSRVGYMNEGTHTQTYLKLVKDVVREKELELEFHCISGIEEDVLLGMRSCEVFLSMNIGKSLLWGEGCPRTVIEALSTGCVVIAFDVIGNRETIQDNFNSILVPRYRPDVMAQALIKLYTFPNELERLRQNALTLIQSCHTLESRFFGVTDFLQLK